MHNSNPLEKNSGVCDYVTKTLIKKKNCVQSGVYKHLHMHLTSLNGKHL